MIESIFCFMNGRKRTGESGEIVFEAFFSNSSCLKEFIGHGSDFYSNVRCGILHQGETYAGWKISRKGKLLDIKTKTINATKFMEALEYDLKQYTNKLKQEAMDRRIWKKAIRKLDYICQNCIVKA